MFLTQRKVLLSWTGSSWGSVAGNAPKANGDDTFIQMSLPNLERRTLLESINSEEYSTRNNGDVYRWADKCGKITKDKQENKWEN